MRILFVCTGNTCRSCMAEGLLRHMLAEHGLTEDIDVWSAGTAAIDGEPANRKAIVVMEREGADITMHAARQITRDMVVKSDLILTMSMSQKLQVLSFFVSAGKVFTLKEYAYKVSKSQRPEKNLDIADPYGMGYNVYEDCMTEIKCEIEKIIRYLLQKKTEDKNSENSIGK